FAGTAPDLAHSDGIDVIGIDFGSAHFSDSYDDVTGVLTLSDGIDTASLKFVGFTGGIEGFHFAEDASGSGTLITAPPAETATTVSPVSPTDDGVTTQSSSFDAQQSNSQVEQNASVAIGGPSGDHFIFAPGIGADTIVGFNPQQDTIELDHFTSAQT